jgi:hypothetical protein
MEQQYHGTMAVILIFFAFLFWLFWLALPFFESERASSKRRLLDQTHCFSRQEHCLSPSLGNAVPREKEV